MGTRGGWRLTLTCLGCGTIGHYDGVVPGITLTRAVRDGWDVDGAPVRGLCGDHVKRDEFNAAAANAYAEADLEAAIAKYCKDLHLLYYHTHRSQHSPAGFPDAVIVGTRVLFREQKRENGKVTPKQQEWLDRLAAAGEDVGVYRPSDYLSGRIRRELLAITLTPAHRWSTSNSTWPPTRH